MGEKEEIIGAMGLFGKKKEEFEEDDDLTPDEDRQNRRLTRKFKDLNPENATLRDKKNRKEPPKPWGKKERMMVLIILLVTVIISAGLMLSAHGFNLVKFTDVTSKINSFDFSSLNFLKEETIEIRKK